MGHCSLTASGGSTWLYRMRFERRSDEPLVLINERRRPDAFLAQQAAAGADFRDGVTIEGLSIGPDGATLEL